MRILLGLSEISGYYNSLNIGFKQLGYQCEFWQIYPHKFTYSKPESERLLVSLHQKLANMRSVSGIVLKLLLIIPMIFLRIIMLIQSLFLFDIFVFGFEESFLKLYDLPILKLFGKKILLIYHGTDSRPPFMDGVIMHELANKDISELARLCRIKKRRIIFAEKFSNWIIDTPTQGLYHNSKFINWICIGWARELPKSTKIDNSSMQILHCPSHRACKGSDYIESIVSEVKKEFPGLSFVTLEGVSNKEVLEAIRKSKIIIDQSYSDIAMPGFAAEASSFCKPVLVGGYAQDIWSKTTPEKFLPPTLFVKPDKMQATLKELLRSEELCNSTGQSCYDFLKDNWLPSDVASRFIAIFNNQIPEEWWLDPLDLDYVKGVGLDSETVKKTCLKLLNAYGIKAFKLHPAAEKSLRQLTGESLK